jgi:methyltransferase (TIGR00027 family)
MLSSTAAGTFVKSKCMQSSEPSRTALGAAFHRAAHQVVENGSIFADPLALPILGMDAAAVREELERRGFAHSLRLFIAARTRFAEDSLAAACGQGIRQLVVLGAGLDTYAYRGALRDRLRIFEVDHPATQAWKRQRLTEAGITLPACLTFAPVDFEHETLADGLAEAGLDRTQPSFFTGLGVVPYLTEEAVWSTLGFIAGLPDGAHVVFDYPDPPDSLSPEMRVWHDRRAAYVAAMGEPWRVYFEPAALHDRLKSTGFSTVEDLGPPEIAARFWPGAINVPSRGGHILRAATV